MNGFTVTKTEWVNIAQRCGDAPQWVEKHVEYRFRWTRGAQGCWRLLDAAGNKRAILIPVKVKLAGMPHKRRRWQVDALAEPNGPSRELFYTLAGAMAYVAQMEAEWLTRGASEAAQIAMRAVSERRRAARARELGLVPRKLLTE